MSISNAAPPISFFCSQICNRRLGGDTLRLLESLLVCKDVESLIEVQSSLTKFIRSESISVMREIAEKTVEQKLEILEFFIRAFALLGDEESCLALKYEALLLREVKCSSFESMQVSYGEWLNFAEQLLECGFYSNARQACENAMSCLQKGNVANSEIGHISGDKQVKRLQDIAVEFSAASSVQAQAAKYLKGKIVEKTKACTSRGKQVQCSASTAFRNGIKKRNERRLSEYTRISEFPR